MNKYINKWFIPICLLITISPQIREYLIKGEIHTGNWGMVVVMIPVALKGFEVNVSKYLEWLFNIIAALLIIIAILLTIW